MKILPTWKNATYRQSLTAGTQTPLPTKLIGEVELTDADLESVHGGNGSGILTDNLSDNNINVLNGANTFLNNVGILGVGSSGNSHQTSNEPSHCSNQRSDNCHRRRQC